LGQIIVVMRTSANRPAVLVSAYAPRELVDDFKARAEAEDRSLSATVRRAMRQYLTNETPAEQDEGLEKPAGQGRYAAA